MTRRAPPASSISAWSSREGATRNAPAGASMRARVDRWRYRGGMQPRPSWAASVLLGLASLTASACGDIEGASGDDLTTRPPKQPPTCPEEDEACEDECTNSSTCNGGVCAADFDPARGGIGAFECRDTCIPLNDDAQWCTDASSCCDPTAECSPRGYCVSSEGTGTGTGTGTGMGTGTDSGTGTSTDSGTDTDTSTQGSSSDSDSGTTTGA